jgi:hypothetical protein
MGYLKFMILLHINSGCTLEVINSNSKTHTCKVLSNPNNISYIKVGSVQKVGVNAVGITYTVK